MSKDQQSGNVRRRRDAVALWETRRAEIVALYVHGPLTQAALARHFGCSQQGVAKAMARMGIAAKVRGASDG